MVTAWVNAKDFYLTNQISLNGNGLFKAKITMYYETVTFVRSKT